MTAKKPKAVAISSLTERERAKLATMPSANAAAVMQSYGQTFGEQDVSALIKELSGSIGQLKADNLHHCEAMLFGQAQALQSIFVSLARRATNQEYLKQYETYLRLALKAQNQSRMTLETLATIKNPPLVFAKQANINQGSGNQQVNNGPTSATRTENNLNQQNELLTAGAQNGKTVDVGGTGAAGQADTHLEAVGALNRG